VSDWWAALERDGYAVLPAVFGPAGVANALAACTRALAGAAGDPAVLAGKGGPAYGARNLYRLWPDVIGLARTPLLADALTRVLGPRAGVVRALYFDKPPGHSWALPWHKDFTIAVKAHGPLGRFQKPTVKAGVPHVEASVELLSRMVTARVHLDPMTNDNGPLRVIPGSHTSGDTPDSGGRESVTVRCEAGDVLLMRPLLAHASGHSAGETSRHRRVVHLECAPAEELPDGYEWQDFVSVRTGDGQRSQ
jgi:hypothetical protein